MGLFLCFFVAVLGFSPALATEKGASFLCRKHISYTEKKQGIPQGLLAAISIIESGKKAAGHPDLVAWPWVINVEGKPEYYKTKTDAVKALSKHLESGIVNIDVGCMQINFKYHGAEFRSPSYMLDPRRNVTYAAQFLGELYKKYGSWTKAVGFYHSATTQHQVPYRHKVYRKWQKVRHAQKRQQTQEHKKKTSLIASLLRPLNKNPATRATGYEVIRPKHPAVTLKNTKPSKSFGGLRRPNKHHYSRDSALQADDAGRKPYFFKGQ